MDTSSTPVFQNREEMPCTSRASVEDILEKLHTLWTMMGFNDQERKQRVDIFYSYLNDVLSQLYQEEKDQYQMLQEVIENSRREARDLCWELGFSAERFSEPEQDLLPLQMKEYLSAQLKSLRKEKNVREKAVAHLRETERPLCLLLDMPALELSSATGVPTKQDLLELEEHVKMLEVEKGFRLKEYYSSKRELTTIIEETEYLPDCSFGTDLFFGDDQNIILSQKNMKELKELVEKAYHKKCEMERELESLRERLQTLWDRLSVEDKERTTFLESHSGCKMSVISAFEREIGKCEELKKQNIAKYIDTMRNELMCIWDKCYVSQEERKSFKPFYDDDFTEELLDLHDAEVQKLKEFFKENEPIFSKINRRNQLWEKMIAFEKKASDPNRFTNRGGQLLQEEKERNRLMKELPRLETEIFEAIIQYEEKTGKNFLVNGQDFEKVVEDQRKEFLKEREKEKLERKQRAKDVKPFANCSNVTPAKRLLNTPSMTPSKFRRMNTGLSSLRVPGSASKIGLKVSPGKTPKVNKSRMLRQSPKTVPRRRKKCETLVENAENVPKSTAVEGSHFDETISSYSEFTRELNKTNRSNLRSSSNYFLRSTSCSPQQSGLPALRRLTPFRGKLGLPFLI